jgi:hypothetical protein
MSSQAASISAWKMFFPWPSMVAAFSVIRRGPAIRSAAREKMASRSSQSMAAQSLAADAAASMAMATSFLPAW